LFIILVNPVSKQFWNLIPMISSAGPHRLLILIAFFCSLLSGYFVLVNKKKEILIYIVIILAISTTILNWGQRRVISEINDNVLISNLPLSTVKGEAHFYANSKWVNSNSPWFSKIPNNNIEIIKGKGLIKNLSRSSTNHVYQISANSDLQLRENTLFFPGWTATSNGKNHILEPDKNGIIRVSIPKGNYILKFTYNDLPLFTVSKILSIFSFILITMHIVYYFIKINSPKFPKL
jgi:hypothetical protein